MIKIENTEVFGFEAAIRGCRNPLNSWDKSDSGWCSTPPDDLPFVEPEYVIGENDLTLMKKLVKAGSDHSKFMRMINVTLDITAPLYWISELDTYKVGTVRNSCSFMHKGTAKPFDITDFSIHDDRVYEILSPLPQKEYTLTYDDSITDYKIYTCANGRKYQVYKNGRIFSEPFECIDTTGRHRHFDRKECKPSRTRDGYFELNIGGRNGERWMLHRLIATVWLSNDNNYSTVNHIDGNKGNNCADNLEWCSLPDNISKGFEDGLFDNISSLHSKYIKWKNGHKAVSPFLKAEIYNAYHRDGLSEKTISEKYQLTTKHINQLVFAYPCENQDLFLLCYTWEQCIDTLNDLRDIYLDERDETIFQQIRCLLPCGYNQRFTMQMNYAVLRNIYHSRKDHRLDEWKDFCKWIETLPYSELITD